MKIEDIPMVMTVKDLSKILQIGINAAYDLTRSDQLQVLRIGHTIRITRSALLRYLGML